MKINGITLRVIRERSGLSGAQLAQACELSPQHLSDIELGKRNPSPAVLDRLTKTLDIPVVALLVPERVA